ncbi:hypothetical protein JCM19232_3101 [Vibrio ishigakensis]|uniref:Uncharacterized protein n=1 Tax=Vibrio ishigakensis TaxID=1481914 RepID=A0A0B8PNS3_9VIBR|nr:hypothetical protein JCM19232_3101 [Vibrio ishigakensis]
MFDQLSASRREQKPVSLINLLSRFALSDMVFSVYPRRF